MKNLSNAKITVSEDGKSVTITADIQDTPFQENIITRTTHPHNDVVANHVRHVQSSNAAVFVRHRGSGFFMPNEIIIAIGAAIEPATSFPPHFHGVDKLTVHSELPFTLQWQVSDNAFPKAEKQQTPPPPAIWNDIEDQTKPELDKDSAVKSGQWIRLVATNASGKTISKPVKVK
jgi:hypothetical protein